MSTRVPIYFGIFAAVLTIAVISVGCAPRAGFPVESPTIPPTPASLGSYPAQPVNSYEITWENLTDRIDQISAAAWTDAQITIQRNSGLPSASDVYVSYVTAGARKVDHKIDEIDTYLGRAFRLLARFPHVSRVFFVALTRKEIAETEKWLKSNYPGTEFVTWKIDEMYGINTSLPKGSVFTSYRCGGWDAGRNSWGSLKNLQPAVAVMLGVCPPANGSNPHFEGLHGMIHEYVHTISYAMKNPFGDVDSLPCWFLEGEPEWIQAAASPTFMEYLRAQHYHPYLQTRDGLEHKDLSAREWLPVEVEDYLRAATPHSTCGKTSQFALAYSLGAATVEALASIGGSDSILMLQQLIASRVAFSDAFAKVYGISWEVAIPLLAEVVAVKISKSWADDALTYQSRPAP